MRPLVLVRLAQKRQARWGCTLRELGTIEQVGYAMRRIFCPSGSWR